MEKITEKCTGCRACEQNCPVNCISMLPDKEGFLTYSIDQTHCIDCGKCVRTCPQNHIDKVLNGEPKMVLAARLKDDALLYKSASGGAFAGIASKAISDGWIVFGVKFNENLVAQHGRAETIDELYPLLSSKYVQSDTLATFTEVRNLLKEGRKVIYSGTGCQIGGLKSFLGKDYDNLVTIDVVCHGVPSPLLFAKYIDTLKAKHKVAQISEYDFRDKKSGWGLDFRYKVKDADKNGSCTKDAYFMYFLKGYTYRECCYECKYAQKLRTADITIADYWGIEKEHPEFYDRRGVSLVLLNTPKGENLWNHSSEDFISIVSTFNKAARKNGNLLHPTQRKDSIRDLVYDEINTLTSIEYFKKHLPYHRPLKSRIKALIPSKAIVFLKKLK